MFPSLYTSTPDKHWHTQMKYTFIQFVLKTNTKIINKCMDTNYKETKECSTVHWIKYLINCQGIVWPPNVPVVAHFKRSKWSVLFLNKLFHISWPFECSVFYHHQFNLNKVNWRLSICTVTLITLSTKASSLSPSAGRLGQRQRSAYHLTLKIYISSAPSHTHSHSTGYIIKVSGIQSSP